MTQIGSSWRPLQIIKDKTALDATGGNKPTFAAGQKGDNVAHTSAHLGNFVADLEDAVKVAETGTGQVAQFDGDLKTKEVYLRTGDQLVAMSVADAKNLLQQLKGQLQAGALTLSDISLKFSTVGTDKMVTKGNINQADLVLKQSNGKTDDGWWKLMNGGSDKLNAKDVPTSQQVGTQDKPGEWYNGITIVNGAPKIEISDVSPTKTIPTNPPMKTMDDLKSFIKQNLDFNGTFKKIEELSKQTGKPGLDIFLEAMSSRINKDPNQAEFMKALAKEIYSYATTGAGTDGKTDIGKMQAILKGFAPEIHSTASSNTPFDGESFKVGGQSLQEGDGKLGRATMLEMRHIGAELELKKVDETVMTIDVKEAKEFTSLLGPDDVFAFDKSGSGNAIFDYAAGVIEEHIRDVTDNPNYKIDRRNSFSNNVTVLAKNPANATSKTEKPDKPLTVDSDDILKEAFKYLGAEDFMKAFGLDKKQGRQYITDGQLDLTKFKEDFKLPTAGESALKCLAGMMLFSSQFSDEGIKEYMKEHGGNPPRINAVADEPEQQPHFLLLVQALAKKKAENVGLKNATTLPIRIMAVPTGTDWVGTNTAAENINKTRFIDVTTLSPDLVKKKDPDRQVSPMVIQWIDCQKIRPGV